MRRCNIGSAAPWPHLLAQVARRVQQLAARGKGGFTVGGHLGRRLGIKAHPGLQEKGINACGRRCGTRYGGVRTEHLHQGVSALAARPNGGRQRRQGMVATPAGNMAAVLHISPPSDSSDATGRAALQNRREIGQQRVRGPRGSRSTCARRPVYRALRCAIRSSPARDAAGERDCKQPETHSVVTAASGVHGGTGTGNEGGDGGEERGKDKMMGRPERPEGTARSGHEGSFWPGS